MSGPKRNPDKLNTIGVVVVGICGAVLVYVTIVALQAFYMNNTSEIQTMADYGGQDVTAKGHKADEMRNITEAGRNNVAPGAEATYRIPIDKAMQLVIDSAKADPSHLVPALPSATKPTIEPVFGRPKPAAPAPAGGAAGSAAPEAGSAAGSAAVTTPSAPMTPTGVTGQPQPVAGAGGAPAGGAPSTGVPTPNTPPVSEVRNPAKAGTPPALQPKKEPKAGAKGTEPKAGSAAGSAQPK
jgi:hypothetical protein